MAQRNKWSRANRGSALVGIVLLLSGCAGGPLTTREKATLGGAALGAGTGAIIGGGKGAAIGGALGGLGGAAVGGEMQAHEQVQVEQQRRIEQQQREIEQLRREVEELRRRQEAQ